LHRDRVDAVPRLADACPTDDYADRIQWPRA
jgi:hypothetical protein